MSQPKPYKVKKVKKKKTHKLFVFQNGLWMHRHFQKIDRQIDDLPRKKGPFSNQS